MFFILDLAHSFPSSNSSAKENVSKGTDGGDNNHLAEEGKAGTRFLLGIAINRDRGVAGIGAGISAGAGSSSAA